MDFNTGGKILGFKKRDVSAVGEKGDPVALWRQAVFLSRPVRWSATTAVLTGLRGSSKWDSFSCSLQTKCTCEPQQELGHLFWQLSPAVTGRGILIQREMAQHADESLTNATHRRVRLGKRKPPMAWINARDSACSCEKPRRFGEAWPSKSIFIAVSALLLQPQVSASIPSSLAAGLSAVSLVADWDWKQRTLGAAFKRSVHRICWDENTKRASQWSMKLLRLKGRNEMNFV